MCALKYWCVDYSGLVTTEAIQVNLLLLEFTTVSRSVRLLQKMIGPTPTPEEYRQHKEGPSGNLNTA